MEITLSNGKKFKALGAIGRPMQYQGVYRDTITFTFSLDDENLSDIVDSFTSEACNRIQINDNDNVFIHEHYSIRISAGVGHKSVVTETPIGGTNDIDPTPHVIYVRMAQTTLTERLIQGQQETIDSLLISSLEG